MDAILCAWCACMPGTLPKKRGGGMTHQRDVNVRPCGVLYREAEELTDPGEHFPDASFFLRSRVAASRPAWRSVSIRLRDSAMDGLFTSVAPRLSLSIMISSASSFTWMVAVRAAPVNRIISPKKLPGPSVATTLDSRGDFSTTTSTLPLLMITGLIFSREGRSRCCLRRKGEG